jgi:uncharacterized protein (DUF305 family)
MKHANLVLLLIATGLVIVSCENKRTHTGSSDSVSTDTAFESSGMMGMDTALRGFESSGMMRSRQAMMDEMHQMKMSGNTDNDLATMLIYHHKGAINMAEEELESGADQELKDMAQKIKDMSQKEIDDLNAIAERYKSSAKDYSPENKSKGLGMAMNKHMKSMMEMGDTTVRSVDHQFAKMMKMHHQHGIEMGEMVLEHSKDQTFKSMAQKTISDQKKDVQKLQQWLDKQKE